MFLKMTITEGLRLVAMYAFTPCAAWYNNGEEVLVPNSEVPSYEKSYLSALISKESVSGFIKKDCSNFDQILFICHEQGHGDENDLKLIQEYINDKGHMYKTI